MELTISTKSGNPLFDIPIPSDSFVALAIDDTFGKFSERPRVTENDVDATRLELQREGCVEFLLAVVSETRIERSKNRGVSAVTFHFDDGRSLGPARSMTGLSWGGCPVAASCRGGKCTIETLQNDELVTVADITGISRFYIDHGYLDASGRLSLLDAFLLSLYNAAEFVKSSKESSFVLSVA